MATREFSGLSPRVAKRRALQYWYVNRDALGLSLAEFFERCRVRRTGGATHITFYGDERSTA